MARYYYGTTAGLGWVFAHYFFARTHFTWLATEYFPYRLPNPKSSNPHYTYQDLYQPWRDRDDFDKTIAQFRVNLHKGVFKQEALGNITSTDAARLKDVCDLVDIAFLYPIVYRVDIDSIDVARCKIAGSGLAGSHEILIPDLQENEFDILFLDDRSDPDFCVLVHDERSGVSVTSAADALTILEGRC